MRALVTGATGFVGGRLARLLAGRGDEVRALVRDSAGGRGLERAGCTLHAGNVLDARSLRGAGHGADVAYYLVHGMGRGSAGDFEDRDRTAARNFARMASEEGVGRVVYLGGLGDRPLSRHLRSRHETARILEAEGPALTYFRAAMVVGVDDVLAYLASAPEVSGAEGRQVQIGGPDILSYGQMLDRMARSLGRRPPLKIPVPVLTPRLSSYWIGLFTPVDAGVARPLVESLSTETVVTDPSGAALFAIAPIGFDEALGRVLSQEPVQPTT